MVLAAATINQGLKNRSRSAPGLLLPSRGRCAPRKVEVRGVADSPAGSGVAPRESEPVPASRIGGCHPPRPPAWGVRCTPQTPHCGVRELTDTLRPPIREPGCVWRLRLPSCERRGPCKVGSGAAPRESERHPRDRCGGIPSPGPRCLGSPLHSADPTLIPLWYVLYGSSHRLPIRVPAVEQTGFRTTIDAVGASLP